MLEEHFDLQEELQVQFFGKHWDTKIPSHRIVCAILAEVGKFLEELSNWKWWTAKAVHREEALLKLVNIWHFYITFFLKAGSCSPSLVVEEFRRGLLSPPESDPSLCIKTFAWEVLQLELLHTDFSRPVYFLGRTLSALGFSEAQFDHLYKTKLQSWSLPQFSKKSF